MRAPWFRALATAFLALAALTAAEPSIASNGWSNVPGVFEGVIATRPIDTTVPAPPRGYVEYLPKGYSAADPSQKWPLLVFISGLGESGDGTDTAANNHQLYANMTRHGPFHQMLAANWDFPGVVVAVQQQGYWNNATILQPMYEYLKANYRIDPNRMYLTGLCEGAVGVVCFAAQHPGYLAGILPIECGTPPTAGQAAAIKDLPMWAVHCFGDNLIARTSTIAWVDQAAQAEYGASDVMSTYPGYNAKPYHAAVDSDPVTNLPLNPLGPTLTLSGANLTNGSTWIPFTSPTFGSAMFNSWGGTDAWPYARINVGPQPDSWVKTGLMFRESTAAGSRHVIVAQGPNNEVFMQWRTATNGASNGTGRLGGTGSIKWLKLVRSGSSFTGSYSVDGTAWTTMATQSVAFAGAGCLGGLAVTAHNNATTYTQTFTGLSIGGAAPAGLTDADIGGPGKPGSAALAGGTWTVTGGGADIWNNADQFNYAYTGVSGDQTMIVRVGSNVPANVVSIGKSNGVYLTRPYAGSTATGQSITIQIPVGYNNTAYWDAPTAKWAWQRNQPWDQSKPQKRIFTMCWYQDHTSGWVDTYSNGGCWDWLYSQARPAPPTITVQPQSVSVAAGQPATFSVSASGAGDLTYQWTRNGSAITGATAAAYTIPSAAMSDNGAAFAVTVANLWGATPSASATLGVAVMPPSVTAQPQSQTVPEGGSATFSVAVTGTPPFSYQWSANGSPISGATASSYSTGAATFAASGTNYSVAISGPGGGTASNGATLTVTPAAPAITAQPQGQSVPEGQSATFSVAATGSAPLAYQWRRNGVDIAGATAASYATPPTVGADSASTFSVRVSGPGGTATSADATLIVITAPPAGEPWLPISGWSNAAGVVEGAIHVKPVNTTVPKPPFGYLDYTPLGYDPAGTATWPLVVYLPSTTEAGDGTDSDANGHQLRAQLTKYGPLYQVAVQHWDFPAIIIVPQVTTNWTKAANIKAVVDYAKANYRVDPTRIFMTGNSEGASGTLRYAVAYPGDLTGILTIEANTASSADQATAIRTLPAWMAHSFADAAIARSISIGWIDALTVAEFGGASGVLATYPGYINTSHFAVDVDGSGKPADPAGDTLAIAGATVTAGSKTIAFPAGTTFGSSIFNLWGGTAAMPFARVQVAGDPAWYPTGGGASGSVTLQANYPGASATAAITIQTPVGYNATAQRNANGTWSWGRDIALDQSRQDRRVLTLFWYQNPVSGWTQTWGSVTAWDWLLTRAKPVAPAIAAQPQNMTVDAGQPATFTVSAGGTAPLAYQWSRNGSAIAGATAATYSIAAAQSSDSGASFTVAVSNSIGTATSDAAVLTVNSLPPSITAQPQNATVELGQAATFTVTATGTGPLAYQWSRDGAPIAGATAASYTLPATQQSDDGASFTVVVSNAISAASSATAVLDVTWSAPAITTQPASQTVKVGQPATFTVAAIGTGPLTYQWSRDGAAIAGATAASYTTAATTASDDGASFAVTVTGAVGQVASDPAILHVDTNAVYLVDLADHQVIQRAIGTTAGSVSFTATYTNNPDHVQARVVAFGGGAVAVDWTTVAVAPGWSCSASLGVPQGGWYQLELRTCDAAGDVLATTAGTHKWGVGINILCIGQSNMQGFGDNVFTVADDRVGLLYGGTTWQHMADPWISGGKASCGPALGNALVAALNIPVGLVPSAAGTTYMVYQGGMGATVLSRRNAANHADTSTAYGQALSAALAAGGVEFVLVSQGANEAVAGNTTADYVAAFGQMRGYFAEDLPSGGAVVYALSQLGRRIDGNQYDVGYDSIREAHRQLDNGTSVLLAGSTMDFAIADTLSHYGGVAQATHGRRFARALLHSLGLNPVYGGPRIAQAQFTDGTYATVRVGIAHRGGSDFAPVSAIPGFVVIDANGPHAVTGTRVDGATIDLTGAAPFTAGASITYLAGENPAGPAGLFLDNQADPEPLLPITVPLAVLPPASQPPAITVQPQDVTAAVGQAATFTVTASGAGTLTYQWSRGGVAIAGATAASYTLPSSAVTDSGAQFSVTVGNDAGSTPSAAATLTVVAPAPGEPTLAVNINNWTNTAGVVEGAIHVKPVNATSPAPPFGYLDYTPLGYNPADATAKWPLIVYLPAAGEAGDGTDSDANGHQLQAQLTKYGPLYQVAVQHWDFPAIIVAPQPLTNWSKALNVKNVVEYAKANYRVDVNRIVLTGNLEGASGALRYAVAYPSDPAGMLAIEANLASTSSTPAAITGVPLWAAHSFADQAVARSYSIGWMDALAVAEFGGTSNVMGTYPGYINANHFAVDVDASGKPADPNGATTTVANAAVTAGSKTIAFPAGTTFGSNIFNMWGGTAAMPFARVQIAGDPAWYIVAGGSATSLTLLANYPGSSATAAITIQTPVGYSATAYRSAGGSWSWIRDQAWDQTRVDKRILTMFWYQNAATGWVQTWSNVAAWNWLLNQVKAPGGSG